MTRSVQLVEALRFGSEMHNFIGLLRAFGTQSGPNASAYIDFSGLEHIIGITLTRFWNPSVLSALLDAAF